MISFFSAPLMPKRQKGVDDDGKSRKALTERLGDGDALHIVVVALEALCREVGHHQGDDITADGGEITPQQTLVHDEIGHGADEGEMPVVPQVDIDCSRTFCNQQQEVDA